MVSNYKTFYTPLLGVDSIFKTILNSSNKTWSNTSVQVAFDFAFFLKNEIKTMLFNKDAETYNVTVCCKPATYDNYLSMLHADGTESESSLNEVLQASSVNISTQLPNVFPDDMQVTRGTYDMKLPG